VRSSPRRSPSLSGVFFQERLIGCLSSSKSSSSCLSSEYFQYLLFVIVYFKYTTSILAHCFDLCEVLKTLAWSRIVELA